MGAKIKTDETKIKEMIEETAKRATEAAFEKFNTSNVNTQSSGTGSKVSQILKNANLQQNINPDLEKEREELKKETDRLKVEREELAKHAGHNHDAEDTLDCPTCKKPGHILKNIGHGKVACTGDNCKLEYALISTKPDYKCTNCGMPHKRAIGNEDSDDCPMCGNDNFLKHDWSKIFKPIVKK